MAAAYPAAAELCGVFAQGHLDSKRTLYAVMAPWRVSASLGLTGVLKPGWHLGLREAEPMGLPINSLGLLRPWRLALLAMRARQKGSPSDDGTRQARAGHVREDPTQNRDRRLDIGDCGLHPCLQLGAGPDVPVKPMRATLAFQGRGEYLDCCKDAASASDGSDHAMGCARTASVGEDLPEEGCNRSDD